MVLPPGKGEYMRVDTLQPNGSTGPAWLEYVDMHSLGREGLVTSSCIEVAMSWAATRLRERTGVTSSHSTWEGLGDSGSTARYHHQSASYYYCGPVSLVQPRSGGACFRALGRGRRGPGWCSRTRSTMAAAAASCVATAGPAEAWVWTWMTTLGCGPRSPERHQQRLHAYASGIQVQVSDSLHG